MKETEEVCTTYLSAQKICIGCSKNKDEINYDNPIELVKGKAEFNCDTKEFECDMFESKT